ncbi:histidine phosphatase family protein [Myxococcota bacterium]|nr:histidine phosphatase family protein [Myxococcota bacterium]
MSARLLILMRHATAASGTGRDFDRPLTRRGLDEAHRVGERLRARGPRPDHVISSSARRCVETWEALASGLGEEPGRSTVVHEDRLYDASTTDLLRAIRDVEGSQTLLVLAHNPGISLLALELAQSEGGDGREGIRGRETGGEPGSNLRDGFAPASVAIFEVAGEWRDLATGSTRLVRFERAPREEKT